MNVPESSMVRAARWLTFASAVSILLGIAYSQSLLALALVALLLSGEKLRLPPIQLPLALFVFGTILAFALSPHPSEGLPQLRKLFVFCELVVVYSCLREMKWIRAVFLTWAGLAAITALRGFVQFVQKLNQAREFHQNDYSYYVGERITGFMSHWNTFSAQEMFALTMLVAFLFFAPSARKRLWVWIGCAGLMSMAVLLAETRAVWIGMGLAVLYLTWFWRRWMILVAPVVVILAFFVSPPVIKDRFTSLLHPKGVDSNTFRLITWRTGLEMIKAHPLLGIGPEGPKYHFEEWLPPDIPRPLPAGWYGHLHNIYLHYAAERGIPAMLVMLWMLLLILYDFWRGLRLLPPGRGDRRYLLHGAIAVVLATMVEGVVELNLGDSEVLTMFLVAVACGHLALEKELAAE